MWTIKLTDAQMEFIVSAMQFIEQSASCGSLSDSVDGFGRRTLIRHAREITAVIRRVKAPEPTPEPTIMKNQEVLARRK